MGVGQSKEVTSILLKENELHMVNTPARIMLILVVSLTPSLNSEWNGIVVAIANWV
ncbi:hypothetical protein MTR_4g024735 [Medicago truncatula]|uniref:Uncharacterized protein n=1 Tax=Medicago truncatula TaxID=3880 RepID=A0A072UT77_MEDTR|nr:hypothetical protein MTR_4g024735 [Medicago truncatula]